MVKFKDNEIVYNVLMHHINHYQEVKRIFKIDYESQMIILTVYSHLLYQTINPSLEEKGNEGLEWNIMFPIIKGLPKDKKKYKKKLSLFSVSQILDIPKESVRRKVDQLSKKRYLEFTTQDGLGIGAELEEKVKMIAPKDLGALKKVITAINNNGGVQRLNKLK